MKIKADQAKYILKLYNRIADKEADCLDEIPINSLRFLLLFDHKELVSPFVREDILKDGYSSQESLSTKYQITTKQVRTIGFYINAYAK